MLVLNVQPRFIWYFGVSKVITRDSINIKSSDIIILDWMPEVRLKHEKRT